VVWVVFTEAVSETRDGDAGVSGIFEGYYFGVSADDALCSWARAPREGSAHRDRGYRTLPAALAARKVDVNKMAVLFDGPAVRRPEEWGRGWCHAGCHHDHGGRS
jgi:hypothetical protein